ncbi:1-aminocyclopropane-1-carboxylate oxidase homolog 3-like, partial [Asparagus officinalis]|uniref:1-aminocyclopropane-1-carboxylate oxidase homolog 3-like n=1 Tax=Asparagus officinalis TaxID=4686 RepID=UPI00098E34AA
TKSQKIWRQQQHHRRRRRRTPPPTASSPEGSSTSRSPASKPRRSGITTPLPFSHPNPNPKPPNQRISIPTVDLSLPRSAVVDLISTAARTVGFFHVINHGALLPVLDGAISAVRSFHELPVEIRSQYYSREFVGGVSYASNFDLFRSAAASWRDTVQIRFWRGSFDPDRIPEICREEVISLEKHMAEVGKDVMGMLEEGMGVKRGRLEEMSCGDGRTMVCHYYPPCPEPEKTMGTSAHTDPSVVTVLVQDKVGGLQVKWKGEWADVEPVEGALLINIGDLLQIMSNDEYKSVEHRVIANSHKEARVSIALFIKPGEGGESYYYGPLPEVVSQEKPAIYRNFTMAEFLGTFISKGLASKYVLDHFKL